jgi:hypothetical protein
MHISTQDFYGALEAAIADRAIAGAAVSRVIWPEGGLFSGRRQYVQVSRDASVFLFSAFPIGSGTYISWWLGSGERGFRAWIGRLPLVGWFVRPFVAPATFYRIDSTLAFQHHLHAAVLKVVDDYATKQGKRRLGSADRQPVMMSFFTR